MNNGDLSTSPVDGRLGVYVLNVRTMSAGVAKPFLDPRLTTGRMGGRVGAAGWGVLAIGVEFAGIAVLGGILLIALLLAFATAVGRDGLGGGTAGGRIWLLLLLTLLFLILLSSLVVLGADAGVPEGPPSAPAKIAGNFRPAGLTLSTPGGTSTLLWFLSKGTRRIPSR